MTALEAKAAIALAIMVLIVAGVTYWTIRERHIGADKCIAADQSAVNKIIADQAKQLADYQQQLEDANEKHAEDQKLLALAAAATVPDIVCHKAHSDPVPEVPTAARGEPATAGVPDEVRQPDFKPVPDLRRLFAGYEGRVETARDALRKWQSSTSQPAH